MKVICKDYIDYKGIHPPRCGCVACWKVYLSQNNLTPVIVRAVAEIHFDEIVNSVLDSSNLNLLS